MKFIHSNRAFFASMLVFFSLAANAQESCQTNLLSTVKFHDAKLSATVQGDFAYVIDQEDLVTLDLTDPYSPIETDRISGAFTKSNSDLSANHQNKILDSNSDHLVVYDVGDENRSVIVYSLASPGQPSKSKEFRAESAVTHITHATLSGTLLAVIERRYYEENQVALYSLDGGTTTALTRITGQGYVRQAQFSGTTLYLGSDFQGIFAYDITDPATPIQTWHSPDYQAAISVVGGTLYTTGDTTLTMFDIRTTPSSPEFMREVELPSHSSSWIKIHLEVRGNIAKLSAHHSGSGSVFTVFVRIEDSEAPLQAIPGADGFYESGVRPFVQFNDAQSYYVNFLDSEIPDPKLNVSGNTTTLSLKTYQPTFMKAADGHLYLVSWSRPQSVLVYDIATDPSNPYPIGEIDLFEGTVTNVHRVGDMLLAVEYVEPNHFLNTIDISDLANPILLNRMVFGEPVPRLSTVFVGSTLYSLSDSANPLLIDFSNPVAPTIMGSWPNSIKMRARDIAIRGNLAYVLTNTPDPETDFAILDNTDPLNPDLLYPHTLGSSATGWPDSSRINVAGDIVFTLATEHLITYNASAIASPHRVSQVNFISYGANAWGDAQGLDILGQTVIFSRRGDGNLIQLAYLEHNGLLRGYKLLSGIPGVLNGDMYYGFAGFAEVGRFTAHTLLPCTSTTCRADLNHDGVLDSGDITGFVSLFLAADLAVDMNNDGILDTGDITSFVSEFLSGC